MMLKSFGCSFIFGSDLDDAVVEPGKIVPSLKTWPALLSSSIGYKYVCYARPGSGNLQILERLINNVSVNDLVVIGWTWIDRFDRVIDKITWPGHSQWDTIRPSQLDTISHTYYRHLHSQYQDKFTNLIYIKTAIDILKQKNCSFIFTYIDDLLFEKEYHCTPAVLELQEYVYPYMSQFDNKTFLNFSKEKEFPISETLHPLEQAHQAAFELIKSYNLV